MRYALCFTPLASRNGAVTLGLLTHSINRDYEVMKVCISLKDTKIRGEYWGRFVERGYDSKVKEVRKILINILIF